MLPSWPLFVSLIFIISPNKLQLVTSQEAEVAGEPPSSFGGDATEAIIAAALEKDVITLSPETFVFDTVLVQKIDRINSVTRYSIPGEEQDAVAFTRLDSNDRGKAAVVLRSSEDQLSSRKSKRIYLVLRRMEPQQSTYQLAAAAIRYYTDMLR
jgi:hypothetical protein